MLLYFEDRIPIYHAADHRLEMEIKIYCEDFFLKKKCKLKVEFNTKGDLKELKVN